MARGGQRGDGKLGCIIGLLVLAAAVVVAVKSAPRMLAVSDFQNEMETIAERASLPAYDTDEEVIERLLLEANSLNLPIAEENIEVDRHANRIRIRASYTMELDYPFYTYVWEKEHDVERFVF